MSTIWIISKHAVQYCTAYFSIELCVVFLAAAYDILANITRLKSDLENIIEPDFGLLEQLLRLGVLTRRQYDDIRTEKRAAYRRSEAVLDLLETEDQCHKFVKALQRTGQQHVVNYITQNGGQQRYCMVTYKILLSCLTHYNTNSIFTISIR